MPFLTEKLSPEQYRNDLKALLSGDAAGRHRDISRNSSRRSRQALGAGSSVRAVISTASTGADPDMSQLRSTEINRRVGRRYRSAAAFLAAPRACRKASPCRTGQCSSNWKPTDAALRLTSEDVIVSWLPLYHDMGLIAGFLLPILSKGSRLCSARPLTGCGRRGGMLQASHEYRGRSRGFRISPTTSWPRRSAIGISKEWTLSSWRAVINCSEPVRWESHQAFFERFERLTDLRWESLQTCYAMAENVFGVTQSDLGRQPAVQDIDRAIFVEAVARARPAAGRLDCPADDVVSGKPHQQHAGARSWTHEGSDAAGWAWWVRSPFKAIAC